MDNPCTTVYIFLHRLFHQAMIDKIMIDCDKIDKQELTYIVGDLPFYTHSQWGSTLKLSNTLAIVPQLKKHDSKNEEKGSKKLAIPEKNNKEIDEAGLKAIHVISSQEFPLKVSSQIVSHLRKTIGINKVVIQHLDPADSQLSPSLYNALAISPIIPHSLPRRSEIIHAFPSKNGKFLSLQTSLLTYCYF